VSAPKEKGTRARPVAQSSTERGAGSGSQSNAKSASDSRAKPRATRGAKSVTPASTPATRVRGATETAYWLLKTEPSSFSFDDLWAAPKRTTGWSGVRNHTAKLFLRDQMRVGDFVLLYHSSAEPTGVAGIARVASAARPDATQFDPADDHFDAKSTRASPTWWEVEVQAVVRCPRFVTLAEIRASPELAGMALLQRGQRLSIQPVEAAQFARVLVLAGLRLADLAR